MRRSMGMGENRPPPACIDPDEAFFAPGSITRQVNGDLPSMLIGGIAALLLQTLHPLTMAGVDRYSNYRQDPLGRLERTASFLGTTTFGSRTEAEAAVARVRRVHAAVTGTAPDGRPYAADDPDLLTWVHAAEIHCFLTSSTHLRPAPSCSRPNRTATSTRWPGWPSPSGPPPSPGAWPSWRSTSPRSDPSWL